MPSRAAALLAAAGASSVLAGGPANPTFTEWAAAHGKTYATREEYHMRRAIYEANVAKYEAHNAQGHTYTLGANLFTDLTGEEFKARYTGGFLPRPSAATGRSLRHRTAPQPVAGLPASVDWQAAGAVTPVPDQLQCGSSWAFAATTSIEAIHFVSTGKLIPLSQQQLVDCSGPEGNEGCNGGEMTWAFQFVIDNKGIASNASYPYTGNNDNCVTGVAPAATISGYVSLPVSDAAMMTALTQTPVATAVEADQDIFQGYTGGVITGACGTQADHGIAVVGYGTDPQAGDYYRLKNWWTTAWGEQGYVRIGRGASYNGGQGQCGVLMQGSYANN